MWTAAKVLSSVLTEWTELLSMFFPKYSETLILFVTPFLHLLARFILELIPHTVSGSLVTRPGITSGGGCGRRSCGLEP